jgi:hypothetical protein
MDALRVAVIEQRLSQKAAIEANGSPQIDRYFSATEHPCAQLQK